MPKYNPGDVVYCKFPLEEDPLKFIDRPALVLAVVDSAGKISYRLAKMTKTDNSHKFPGVWVLQNSDEGRKMRLDYDSFIHLGRIATIPDFAIRRYKGHCPILNDLLRICKEKRITI